jgi:hypothetical protein
MADPISAGVVGSVLAPSAGVALAAPTLTTALGTGLAAGGGMGGGTLFGFNPTIGGFGQGIMEGITGANKFMNQNPITSQLGMQLAGSAFAPDQQMQMAPQGQIRQGQIQPMDYMSLLNPQQQSVIRPQPISLLG